MRELLRVTGAAAAVLILYFGYMLLIKPKGASTPGLPEKAGMVQTADVPEAELRETRVLMELLEEYRDKKGSYPVLPSYDVSRGELKRALSSSGISFRSPIVSSESDNKNRYVSVTGKSYGLLIGVEPSGQPATCIVEVDTHRSGWWGQPPACRL